LMLWVLVFEIVILALSTGLRTRRVMWDTFEPVRHTMDISNGWGWGERALRYGFFKLYDHVIADRPDGDFSLDYTPLRLAVMTTWARWTNHAYPGIADWRGDYAFNAPLLHLNTLMELISTIGIFLLVRVWTVRGDLAPPGRSKVRNWLEKLSAALTGARPTRMQKQMPPAQAQPFQGCGRGLLAALLFWFNPALLIDGHAWPQWDVWPVPFFVFALLAATTERWFVAGLLLGVGVMLKGQLMLVAPLFVLWPLFMNAPRAATKVVLGFCGMIALIASPWLIGHGALWVAGVVLVPAIVRRDWYRKRPLASVWITVPIALELVVWPLILPGNQGWVQVAAVTMLAIVIMGAGRRLSSKWWMPLVALGLAGGLFLCPILFDGSMAWYKIGFTYGAGKFQEMTIGAENLAAILERSLGTAGKDGVFVIDVPAIFLHHVVTVQQVLGAIYGVTLVVASMAAAMHSNRRDPRLLVAAIMPWVMFFALLTRMHERYLVWAACLSAAWVAAGVGMTLVHLLISGLAFMMIAQTLVLKQPEVYPVMAGLIKAASGGLAWMVLLAGCMVVFGAVMAAQKAQTGRPAHEI
jgi:hypothetical protein